MKVLCIDSNSILNRAFYGIRLLSTKDGTFTNGIFGFLNILFKLQEDVKPDCIVCAFDVKAPTFRHKQYDGYKAQRKGMPPELAMQMPILKELLTAMGIAIVELEGYEADDILGTFAKTCMEKDAECFIATGDKDSLQLISPKVTVLLASSRMGKTETVVCDPAYVLDKYGLEPKDMIQVKALMGDASDNIPGVPGVGEKTALALIQKYKTVDYIYNHLEEIDVTAGVRTKLASGKESAFLSLDLAEIFCKVPVDLNLEHYQQKPRDDDFLAQKLTSLEMYKILERLRLSPQAGAAVSQAPVSPQKPVEITQGAEHLKNAVQTLERLCFYLPMEQGSPVALYLYTKEAIFLCNKGDELDSCIHTVFTADKKKATVDAKGLYRYALDNGIPLVGIDFDITLAGYLLSPNSTDYPLEKLCGEYGVLPLEVVGDTQLSHEIKCIYPLYEKLAGLIAENEQKMLLEEIEIPLSQVLASMEQIGFSVDSAALTQFGQELDKDIARLEEEIYTHAGKTFNINSPKQMGEVLFGDLGLPTRKKTKSGYSTNAEVLESLRGKHPVIDSILEYRKLAKLKSTYVEGLLKVIGEDGRIHSTFNQTETRTGRISSTEPNLQNIPVRTELGSQMRKFFRAKEGTVLVDADYSQIELRVLAHIAGDKHMIEAFQSGEDIHTRTASQVFDLPPLFVTPELRSKAKAVNFGIVYGIGAFSLSQDIGVSVAEADQYIKQYLQNFDGVRRYMDDTIRFAQENGYVKTMFGRRRLLPELASQNKNLQAFGKRVAMNTPIQGTAADIIKIAMVHVYRRLQEEKMETKLILQVHDELLLEAPFGEQDKAKEILRQEMEHCVKLSVGLDADVSCGENWYAAKFGG